MAWKIAPTSSFYQGAAYKLYNFTNADRMPQSKGVHGIDEEVWRSLIALTRSQFREVMGVDLSANEDLRGACIYASVIAAKFYRHRLGYKTTRVVHVEAGGSDHYFALARNDSAAAPLIIDITARQFTGAPDYLVGRLEDVKDRSKPVKVHSGPTLYDAYALGAKAKEFLM